MVYEGYLKEVTLMSYESSFNKDFARKLARSANPEKELDAELSKFRERALKLNSAREKMAEGYEIVLQGLKLAFPNLDMNDKNLTGTFSSVCCDQ